MDTKKLRQKILDLAIRGKLVPQDPNDEPASVLLERIRAEKERLIKEGKIKRSKKSADTPNDENETPFEIPESWEWVKLSDIASFGGGKTPSMEEKKYWNGGTNLWITSKDMKSAIIADSMMKITDAALPLMTIYEPGTLLIVTRSGILRRMLPIAILDKKACVNQDLKAISLYLKTIHKYIYYVIKANEVFILKKYHKDGTTVDSINFEKFIDFQIPLPPLAEQQRIVSAIEQWFAVIDILENAKDDLQTSIAKAKSKILDLAIHGKLVPQDSNDEPASVLLERIRAEKERLIKEGKIKRSKRSADTQNDENEAPFEIPESWEWTTLGEISDYGNCQNVDIKDIPDNAWILELEDLEKDSAKIVQRIIKSERDIKGVRHSFHKGEVLYSKLRTYLNKVLVAPEDGFCTTEIIPISRSAFICPEYLSHVLRSKFFLDYTIQCGYGVKMPRLSTTDACNGFIPLPPFAEQQRIVAKIEELFAVLDNIKESIEV